MVYKIISLTICVLESLYCQTMETIFFFINIHLFFEPWDMMSGIWRFTSRQVLCYVLQVGACQRHLARNWVTDTMMIQTNDTSCPQILLPLLPQPPSHPRNKQTPKMQHFIQSYYYIVHIWLLCWLLTLFNVSKTTTPSNSVLRKWKICTWQKTILCSKLEIRHLENTNFVLQNCNSINRTPKQFCTWEWQFCPHHGKSAFPWFAVPNRVILCYCAQVEILC